MSSRPTISVEELVAHKADIVVIDASWIYGPFNQAGIDVRARYCQAHIPGAWFLDLRSFARAYPPQDARIDAVTRPPRQVVRELIAAAVPAPQCPIVITDMDGGCTTAPFARLLLIDSGYPNVRLLDGGTPAWTYVHRRRLTDDGPRFLELAADAHTRSPAQEVGTDRFATLADVAVAIADPSRAQLLDCRGLPDNHGVLPEDYRTVEIPCTCIVRSPEVVEEAPHGHRFRKPPRLAALLAERRVSSHANKIATCYFGVGAAVVATAFEIAGWGPVRVYAGSLIEYAQARWSG